MNCPICRNELEIFAKANKEIYICPSCFSALIPDEASIKVLRYFCNQEILGQLISNILDDSFLGNIKSMLSPQDNLACPKCKSYMQHYDFDKKLRFYVNRCISCGAVWANAMQIPLVAITFIEDSLEDVNFKRTIDNLYEIQAKKRNKPVRPFDEIIAPYLVLASVLPSIPMGDNVLTKTYPFQTRNIIVFCVFVFLSEFLFQVEPSFSLIANNAFANSEWYRLLTYAFFHGGIVHLAGNMWFLWIFGKSVEDELGWVKYYLLFFLGAIFSGIFFIITTTDRTIPCVGASGAISAIIGTHLILFPKARLRFNLFLIYSKIATTSVSSLVYIFLWVITNILFGVVQSAGETRGVAYWSHVGGFITGILFAEVYKNFKRK